MLGIPLRYLLKHPAGAVTDLAAVPRQTWTTICDEYVYQREQRGPRYQYESDKNSIAGPRRQQQIAFRLANIDETRLADRATTDAFWNDAARRLDKLARLTPSDRREIEIELVKMVRKRLALVQAAR